MRVTLTGATGTIGRALVRALLDRGDEVTVLTRDPESAARRLGDVQAVAWPDPLAAPPPVEALAGRDGVVHLAGESVAQRWSEATKRAIRDSRVLGTRHLVAGLRAAEPRPKVLVSGSATGWYGPHGDERLDESAPAAQGDFLAEVTEAWEREAAAAQELGVRVAMARTGVVLSESGGALEQMLPPFKLGVGGPIAGGGQYIPWIHLDDEVGALLFLLDTEAATGPVNLTAPEPVTNKEFSKTLGRVLRRPAFAPVPGFAIKLLFGEMGTVVTSGARVIPARLQELGYAFKCSALEPALRAALR